MRYLDTLLVASYQLQLVLQHTDLSDKESRRTGALMEKRGNTSACPATYTQRGCQLTAAFVLGLAVCICSY